MRKFVAWLVILLMVACVAVLATACDDDRHEVDDDRYEIDDDRYEVDD